MDNDQANFQPLIPAHTTVDVRLGGEWSTFSGRSPCRIYSTCSISIMRWRRPFRSGSSAAIGTYNAYPLAGRTFMVRAGATF